MRQVYSGTLVNAKDIAFLSLYAADVVIIMLLLAIWRFAQRNWFRFMGPAQTQQIFR